jgi:uncharacterized protein (TIGR02996 family)
MGTFDSLLQLVIEAPDDNGPRLACADWLEQHGEGTRADFIRVQCFLDQMSSEDSERPGLVREEQQMLQEHGWEWAEDFGTQISEWTYRRGFVERVAMNLETSAETILSVLRKGPVRHLRDLGQFSDLSGVVDALPHFGRLTGLEFWGLYALDNALLARLLQSPHLTNLRVLILHHDRNGNMADEKVLLDAINSPYRVNLEELAIDVDGM